MGIKAVVIADDEQSVINLMQRYMEARGYMIENGFDVHYCTSGEEAWDIFLKKKIILAFLDKKMPGMTGIEVAKRVKSISPDTKIYLMSGDTETKTEDYNILAKPFDISEVEGILTQHLGGAKSSTIENTTRVK